MQRIAEKIAADTKSTKRRVIHGIVKRSSEFENFLDNLDDAIAVSAYTFGRHLRLHLLQNFREAGTDRFDFSSYPEFDSREHDKSEFAKPFLFKHLPDYYAGFITLLDDSECEILLKLWPIAHETFGRGQGMKLFVQSFLQHAAETEVPVDIAENIPWTRTIPEEERSYLGRRHSTLGTGFVLGRKLTECQSYYRLYIGPISSKARDRLQDRGWLNERKAGDKLAMLLSLMQPYYKKPVTFVKLIKPIEDQTKFVLGNCVLGRSTVLGEKII